VRRSAFEFIRCAAVIAALLAGATTWLGAQAMQAYRDPAGRFTLEYPKKDWQVFPGGGSTLATIGGNKGKSSVQIEYFKLNAPIKVDENYDLIVGIETDFVRDRQPGADQIKGAPKRPDLKDIVVLDYVRPGAAGADRIRQYSIINGVNLFRVSCVAPASDFAKLEPVFERIAKSFMITSAPRPS
jgi:hypothetical protein